MSRSRIPNPALRLHKPSGRAVVTLIDITTGRRRDVYVGIHGSPEAAREWARVVEEWREAGCTIPRPTRQAQADAGTAGSAVTVADVLRGHYRSVKARYDGRTTSHVFNTRAALRVARSLFGALLPDQFGPKALQACRTHMIAQGWKRKTINTRIRFIVTSFQWGVSQEIVRAETWQALTAVKPLQRGEGGVREGTKVLPVPIEHVEAIKPHVAEPVTALIDLQLLTGARGGELAIMRPRDLNTTGNVWEFRPVHHKGRHRDHERVIYLGPRAQAIVKRFMAGRALDDYLFDPREGNAQRKAVNATRDKPRRPDQKPNTAATARRIGRHYTAGSYRKAVQRACLAAGVPDWHPHQLRHTAATQIRREFGLEAASLILGHGSAGITDAVYAQRDQTKAAEVMLKMG